MPVTASPRNDPPYLTALLRVKGEHEVDGPLSNPLIWDMYVAGGVAHPKLLDDSTTAWCSAALCWAFETSGLRGTRSLAGRSWLKRGRKLDLKKPIPRGAIAVLRYDNDPNHGHVGVVLADHGTSIDVLAGNQGNAVSVRSWRKTSIIGAVWPDGVPEPGALKLPPDVEPAPVEHVPLPRPRPQPDDPGPERDEPDEPALTHRPEPAKPKAEEPKAEETLATKKNKAWAWITSIKTWATGGGFAGLAGSIYDYRVAIAFGIVVLIIFLVVWFTYLRKKL